MRRLRQVPVSEADGDPGGSTCPAPRRAAPRTLGPGRNWQMLVLAVLTVLLTAGCGRVRASHHQEPLQVVTSPWPGYAFLFLADALGYFEAEGVSVQLVELGSLADARRVFEQGRPDVVCASVVELLLMHESRPDLQVAAIAVSDFSCGADVFLARAGIRSVADLRGKRVGLEPESLDAVCATMALNSAGLSLRDVHVVPLAHSEMLAAIRQGRVDAVQVYPPVSCQVERLPGVGRLWDSAASPEPIVDLLIARRATVKHRRGDLRRMLRAFTRAQTFFEEHPDEALALLAERTPLTLDELRGTFERVQIVAMDAAAQRSAFQESPLADSVQYTARTLARLQMLPSDTAPDVLDGSLHEDHP